MKKLLFVIMAVAFISCETDDSNESPAAEVESRILGEWEMYKREAQELSLDFIDGALINSVKWYDLTGSFAIEAKLEFNEDYSFGHFYAEVPVGDGIWNKVDDDTYSITFNDPQENWSEYTDTYVVNFYCDHTMSIQYRKPPPVGDNDFQDTDFYAIQYYRTPGIEVCADLIEYQVD